MDPRLYEVGIVACGLGGWAAVYGLMLLITRPLPIRPGPATQELGDEPPAVVSLLVNGWDVTEDAAEATLLDLAARGYLELRQPAADPHQTTVHRAGPGEGQLSAYEARVLARAEQLMVGDVVPLTALTFRDAKQAKGWAKSLVDDVVADARRLGLSRRRFTGAIVAILVVAALVALVPIAIGIHHYALRHPVDDDGPWSTAVGFCIPVFIVLAAIAGKPVGERDTPAGRQVAARWLGVKEWLVNDGGFAELPPAATTLWGRYLGYGAALGTTRVASRVIDLGLGDRKRVWSSYGGTWHRVRVRYPRLGRRYGRTALELGLRAVLAAVAGYLLVRYWRGLVQEVSTLDLPTEWRTYYQPAATAGFLLGLALLILAGYMLIGILVDLTTPVTITGQVLWRQVWRQESGGEDQPARPVLYYYAIDSGARRSRFDDGRGDRTVAWGLPADLAGTGDVGQVVTIRARRWSRRIIEQSIVPELALTTDPSTANPPPS